MEQHMKKRKHFPKINKRIYKKVSARSKPTHWDSMFLVEKRQKQLNNKKAK